MGGLRALLCCKGDKWDDGQDMANRPVRNIPASSTDANQEKPGDKPEEDCVLDNSGKETPPRNLWKEAYDGLPPKLQEYVPAAEIPATDAIQKVVQTTEEKYKEWQQGGLRYHRKSGKEIDIRQASEKIIGMAMKAKDTISTIVSFDPTGHASSAWTIISFGMSIVQNRLDRRDAVFEASAFLTENMAYFALIDANYRDQGVGSDANVDQALLRAYSAILTFTAEVEKTRDENEAARLWYSISAYTDQSLSKLKDSLIAQKEATKEWAQLASDLGNRERAKEILSNTDKLIESSKNMESKLLTAEEDNQLEWLSSAEFSNRQDILQKKRTGDTGVWLLNSKEYNKWLSSTGDLLWLPGISGCGKSVLCSTVIRDLDEICDLDGSKHYAYWYFEFGFDATQNVDSLIRSLIRQLCRSPLPSAVVNLWKKHHVRRSQPDSTTIRSVLDEVLSEIPDQDRVYLVFDALDECPNSGFPSERESLLSLLSHLLKRHRGKVHILATSRPEKDIHKELSEFPKVDLEARLAEDVKTFVDVALARRLNIWSEEIRNMIRDKLLSFKERRFRWADLQIQALSQQYDENDLRKALNSVPATLEGTYRMVLDSIEPHNVTKAREILMIICLSPVPLDVDVVAKMTRLYSADYVVQICTTSLLALNKTKVQVAHFSVQEYLIVPEKKNEHHECQFTLTEGHKFLTDRTADLLLAQAEPLTQPEAMKLGPFLYAAKHWDTHMVAAGGFDQLSAEIQAKIDGLFTEPNVYFNWVRSADAHGDQIDNSWSKVLAELETPIHRASYMGLAHTVGLLAVQGANPSRRCLSVDQRGLFDRPVDSYHVAARTGHLDALQVLLDLALPLPTSTVEAILQVINYRKSGKAKLAKVVHTLRDQGLLCDHVNDTTDVIHEAFLSAAVLNEQSGLETFHIFLNSPTLSTPITEHILDLAFRSSTSSELPKFLIETFNPDIPVAFIEQRSSYLWSFKTPGLAYLALERPNEMPITENLLQLFARKGNSETMESLLRSRRQDIHVTTEVLELAATNEQSGNMLCLLWPHKDPGTEITEKMISNAADNEVHSSALVAFLLKQPGTKPTLSEETINNIIMGAQDGVGTLKVLLPFSSMGPPVPEEVVARVCCHSEALDMLKLLEKEKSLKGPFTELIIQGAALNESKGPLVIDYLAKRSPDPLPVTEEVLLYAVENEKKGGEIIRALAPYTPVASLTDKVFEEACVNKDAMLALLDQKQREPPFEKMLAVLSGCGKSPIDEYNLGAVFRTLLERQLVEVDEKTVELMASNFYCLDALLSRNPDIIITENALQTAADSPRLMRVMMSAHRSSFPITDNVLLAATRGYLAVEVMQVILNRQQSLPITEKLILEATTEAHDKNTLTWLLNQQSEAFVTSFWENTWNPIDKYRIGHAAVITAFLQKTGSNVTDTMLENWPYSNSDGNDFGLGTFVQDLCTNDKYPDMPTTQRAAEIVLERCDKASIEVFLNHTKLPVTDDLIEAAEKNQCKDKEGLVTFLEQKRGLTKSYTCGVAC
ncbi:hypothetical protein BDQ94DRAFT_168171 [Aspergillus welwitschiae]|uniref:Nephrocystin 3-like N-terminal domain-containing protein n=1 Tax=Aspergillus welwitschiae TaxID=1341132 RepID=A0A3F3Q9G3_9EURO|nr:hypothetical protein BDQ94DRAFT_168171 [Aspergillus welwitschiae]RDH35841.1 hypothetical protein BDQ94DRAFT_168171 [Aspergillus welwitschiae]